MKAPVKARVLAVRDSVRAAFMATAKVAAREHLKSIQREARAKRARADMAALREKLGR